jgi:hypothetical protein
VYQELHGQEALDALQVLVARLMPLVTSETLRLPDPLPLATTRPVTKSIVYRIRLTERTGRFEKR